MRLRWEHGGYRSHSLCVRVGHADAMRMCVVLTNLTMMSLVCGRVFQLYRWAEEEDPACVMVPASAEEEKEKTS